MKFSRRTLCAATLLATTALIPMAVSAQATDWPSRPIRYVVPFSTGGVSDGVARLIAKNLGYDPVKDFAPVNLVGMVSNVLVVPAGSRFDSVQQITAERKAKPDSLTYGTAGAGTSQHLSGQLYQSLTGTQLRQIIYKGGSQAMVDLVGGQIDMVFETVAAARPMIDGKRVKVLGVTSKARLADLPGVPSLAEAGVTGFEMQSWQGVFAPAGTPQPIVDRVAREVAAIVGTPGVQARLRTMGVEPDGRVAAPFAEFQRAEVAKWGKVIREAGIQAE